MEDALRRFHTFNDVFLPGRAGTKPKPKANGLRTELVKKRKVDEERHAGTWTQSKKRREMNAWQEYTSHETDASKELDPDLDYLMIQAMSMWVKQIWRYGPVHQYSAERHEQAHTMNLKDGQNASNHNLNCLPQVITIQRRILCFEVRGLNLQALAQRWQKSAARCKVLPSGAAVAAP